MIEPEMAFVEFEENLQVQENYVSFIVQSVLKNCKIELNTLGRDTSKLEQIKLRSQELRMMKRLIF